MKDTIREELINQLKHIAAVFVGLVSESANQAADMLKADAERIAGYKEDQRELMSQMQAQQVQSIEPIPESKIYEIYNTYYRPMGPVEFTRAIEEYHGIKGD